MQYELKEFGQLILGHAKKTLVARTEIAIEIERIKGSMRNAGCSMPDDLFRRFVRMHQQALSDLISTVLDADFKSAATKEELLSSIELLLFFLLELFGNEIDGTISIPVGGLTRFGENVKDVKDKLVAGFAGKGVCGSLVEVVRQIFIEAGLAKTAISFSRLRFYIALSDFIERIIASGGERSEWLLVDALCYCNANTPAAYFAIKELIQQKIAAVETTSEQASELRLFEKHFRHVPVADGLYYRAEGRVLSLSIADWIRKQIIQKDYEQRYVVEEELLPENDVMQQQLYKPVITSLAIDELGMFLRVQMDCAVVRVPNTNLAGMSRTFAMYYRTAFKGVHEPFKPESLYKFFYHTDLRTIKSVRSVIKRMLHKLDDYELNLKAGKGMPSMKRRV